MSNFHSYSKLPRIVSVGVQVSSIQLVWQANKVPDKNGTLSAFRWAVSLSGKN